MPSNYPNGISSFGFPVFPITPQGPVPNAQAATTSVGTGRVLGGTSNVYFVSSILGADGNPGTKMTPGGPLATLVQALKLVSPGDTIYLLPGHVENITAASTIKIPCANLNIIGLGNGKLRATLVFKTATTATFDCNSKDSLYLYNVRCQSQIAAHVNQFVVTGNDCTFDTVDYYDDGTHDAKTMFQVTGANCTIKNCYWTSAVAPTTVLQWITLNAANGARIYNNYGYNPGLATGNPANGFIVGVTALSTNVDIAYNRLSIDGAGTASVVISLFAATTGLVAYNSLNSTTKAAIAGINAIANCMGYQNFVTHTANKSGLLDPVVDA